MCCAQASERESEALQLALKQALNKTDELTQQQHKLQQDQVATLYKMIHIMYTNLAGLLLKAMCDSRVNVVDIQVHALSSPGKLSMAVDISASVAVISGNVYSYACCTCVFSNATGTQRQHSKPCKHCC
jgi:multidrug resistance efflux pump